MQTWDAIRSRRNVRSYQSRVIDEYDLGHASYASALAAADLGIGSCHSWIGDKAAAQRILGFPDGNEASYMLGFGCPADRPLEPICTAAAGSRR